MSRLIIARVHDHDTELEFVMGFSDGALVNMTLPKSDSIADSQIAFEAFTESLRSCMEPHFERPHPAACQEAHQ